MTVLGNVSLWLALLLGLWGSGSAVLAAKRGDTALRRSAERTPAALLGVLTAALIALGAGVGRQDFNLAVMATYATRAMPTAYTLGALAQALPGVGLVAAWGLTALAVVTQGRRGDTAAKVAGLVSATVACAAAGLLLARPFARLGYTPLEGLGLHPVPRHALSLLELFLFDAGLSAAALSLIVGVVRRSSGPPGAFLLGAWTLLSVSLGLRLWREYSVLGTGPFDVWQGGITVPWVACAIAFHGSSRAGIGRVVSGGGIMMVALVVASGMLGSVQNVRLATGEEVGIPMGGGTVLLSSLGVSRFEVAGGLSLAATLAARRGTGPAALLTTERRQYFNVYGRAIGVPEGRPAVLRGLLSDLRVVYLASGSGGAPQSPPDNALYQVRVVPLAWGVWIGFILMAMGGLLAAAQRREGAA